MHSPFPWTLHSHTPTAVFDADGKRIVDQWVALDGWLPIETRPELDHQPGRQFILLEGHCRHSDADWYRQFAGEAYIRKPGQPDEMLQYRMNDILRICQDGDIDPHTAKVTHWMPGAYPHFPSSLSSAQRTPLDPETAAANAALIAAIPAMVSALENIRDLSDCRLSRTMAAHALASIGRVK